MERRIISICSAPGWGALFDQLEDPDAGQEVVTLTAWALVENADHETRVVGLVQKPKSEDGSVGVLDFADQSPGFAGYMNQGLKTKPAGT